MCHGTLGRSLNMWQKMFRELAVEKYSLNKVYLVMLLRGICEGSSNVVCEAS